MELDDLKNTWGAETGNEENRKLTLSLIGVATHEKYKSKMEKIRYPEMVGSFVCLLAAAFIGARFHQLHTLFLQGAGIVSIVLLLGLSVISFLSLKQLALAEDVSLPYAEVLEAFARQKLKFYRLQKANIILCHLLLVAVVILLPGLFGKPTGNTSLWTMSFTIGYLFLLLVSARVFRYYKTTMGQAEELLRELEPVSSTL